MPEYDATLPDPRLAALGMTSPVALAPMAGITDLPTRDLVRDFGAGLVVSEMVASQEIVEAKPSVRDRAELGIRIEGTSVQIAGREARWMSEAARLLAGQGARIIDINMGCPARKVTGGQSGSALLRDHDHALRLIEAVVAAVDVPVTLKTRLGWDDDSRDTASLAVRAEAAGVRMLTIHGRTRCQFYKGAADWAAIAPIVRAVGIPVLANGDIVDAATARAAIAASGAAGVMIGRGAQGRPWLPADIASALGHGAAPVVPGGAALVALAARHHAALLAFYGPVLGGRVARKHLGWYMDGAGTPAVLRRDVLTAAPEEVARLLGPALLSLEGVARMTDPSIWQALPIPALLLDAADRIVAVNGPAEDFLNRSAKTLADVPVSRVLDLDGGLCAATARVRQAAAPLTLHDTTLQVRPGASLRCEMHLSPFDDGILLLISPQEIAGRLDGARSSRSAARSAIGMAEMLAHEIKNPLAGITGAAQLLGMNLAGEDFELTDLIVAESRRIVKLLEQVEQFGNLRPPERRAVNIHDVLDRARRSAMVGFAAHMNIVEAYDPSLPQTWIDPDQMLQVILNLLKNAAQVGAQGGRITLRTFYEQSLRVRRPDGSGDTVPLQVEVIDDGPGISPEIAGNLFEPFVSGRENGTGLGLALVSKIVHEHGGWISVDSVPGRTAFRLSLPLAPKDMNVKSHGIEE